MGSKLTDLLFRYRKGEVEYSDILNESLSFVFLNMRHCFSGTEEQWSDYILDCVPRIEKAIQHFHFLGKDFEAYLCICLRYHMKSFFKQRSDQDDTLYLVPSFNGDFDVHGSTPPEYTGRNLFEETENSNILCGAPFDELSTLYRRLVIYVLKNSIIIGERFIILLCRKFGLNADWLLKKRNEVLEIIRPFRDSRRMLEDKGAKLLLRLHHIHRALGKKEHLSETKRMMLAAEEDVVRKKIDRLYRRIKKIPLVPAHTDLGKVIGIPKGSIDSALFYLKKNWQQAEDALNTIFDEL